jgi:hypothetical protein
VEAGTSGNVVVTPGTNSDGGKNYTVDLADKVTFGDKTDKSNNVSIDGTKGSITAGDKVSLDGNKGTGTIGGVTIGQQTVGTTVKDKDTDKPKSESGNFVTGLGQQGLEARRKRHRQRPGSDGRPAAEGGKTMPRATRIPKSIR